MIEYQSVILKRMYRKASLTAIGQIFLVITYCFCLPNHLHAQLSDGSIDSREKRKQLYHNVDKERLSVQQTTKTFFSMAEAYDKCISKLASDEACAVSIESLRAKLTQALEIHSKIATPTPPMQPNTYVDTEVSVIIQNNDFFPYPRPTREIVPYQPPSTKPRNSFTPKPGFVPKNRFQAGDGLDQ